MAQMWNSENLYIEGLLLISDIGMSRKKEKETFLQQIIQDIKYFVWHVNLFNFLNNKANELLHPDADTCF